jgi:hypothetical protein
MAGAKVSLGRFIKPPTLSFFRFTELTLVDEQVADAEGWVRFAAVLPGDSLNVETFAGAYLGQSGIGETESERQLSLKDLVKSPASAMEPSPPSGEPNGG